MSREIMRQALEAFEAIMFTKNVGSSHIIAKNARYALREELAKPANEFHPDWDTLKPYHDRIAELEAQLAKPEQPELRKASEMALEYLEYLDELDIAGLDHEIQSEALRQALAQPETRRASDVIAEKQGSVMRDRWSDINGLLAQPEQEPTQAINDVIDYLYSTGADNDMANRAHIALKQLQMNLRDQTALHLLYKGDYEDLIAQPEQEPVAWVTRRTGDGGVVLSGYETCEPTDYDATPVYTAPPSTSGYAKKIESLIKERDELRQTLAQPEQEPVAIIDDDGFAWGYGTTGGRLPSGTKVYTAPQKPDVTLTDEGKTWQGLTSEELVDIVIKHAGSPVGQVFAIEAKLKEKNNAHI